MVALTNTIQPNLVSVIYYVKNKFLPEINRSTYSLSFPSTKNLFRFCSKASDVLELVKTA